MWDLLTSANEKLDRHCKCFAILLKRTFIFMMGMTPCQVRSCRYSLVDLREHIKKRPPIATTEKVQHYIKVFFFLSLNLYLISMQK
jgi:hypothetical protein